MEVREKKVKTRDRRVRGKWLGTMLPEPVSQEIKGVLPKGGGSGPLFV